MSITAAQKRNEEVAARVRARGNTVLREVVRRLRDVPWFAALAAEERAILGDVAGRAVTGFSDWLRSEGREPIERFVFADVPPRMAAIIRLDQTVELVQLMTAVGEELAGDLAGAEHEDWVRREMMRFARDLAFALAGIYAHAAEWRGSVDARLETHLFDLLLSDGTDEEILTAAAALSWNDSTGATAVVGALRTTSDDAPALVTRELRRQKIPAVAGLHGDHLLVLVSETDQAGAAASVVAGLCHAPVVVGPRSTTLRGAGGSLQEAMAGAEASSMLAERPEIVHAADLLPERALLGDVRAQAVLVDSIYQPLVRAGEHVIETVSTYLELGSSLQHTARTLHVHPNTVRYRLARAVDECGRIPADPRDGFVLRIALALGRRRLRG